MSSAAPSSNLSVPSIVDRYLQVRSFTRFICEPLETEDYVIQSMPDVSPTRWHLAHTTWFFETFVLRPYCSEYQSRNDAFEYLFNSYYNTVGKQFPQSQRGVLSRPTVREVWEYRQSVDEAVTNLLANDISDELARLVELGLHHEQQHQELMLTDIKHVLSCNPLFPVYDRQHDTLTQPTDEASWFLFSGGVRTFGCDGMEFCFDNECPRFEGLLQDYQLKDRLVTNRDYLAFMNDGGYDRPEYWLSMGWSTVQLEDWDAPLHWWKRESAWHEFTLHGLRPINMDEPVCHVSYFEADAFARWSGARLPTELEWENAVAEVPVEGNFAESHRFHPTTAPQIADPKLQQYYGDVWEWTASPYTPYPGYRSPQGALGEYNGKFMCNQYVLRGGSCATSQSHIRPTYRNFFPPHARWQFSGIRLAQSEPQSWH